MQGDRIDQLEKSRRFGKEPGVEIAGKLLAGRAGKEGEPWGIPFIHIAGTNGKGSTAAFLAAILQQAGYRTGLFTSPHLIDFTERIRVDGKRIRREKACCLAGRLLEEAAGRGLEPGFFDCCTIMAVDYFTEMGCEIAVMETGLGGRLDATNALGVPLVSVITPIGLDHVQLLGNTLAEVAGEKAGILKPGSAAVIAPQEPEAERVLVQACVERGIPYQLVAHMQEGMQAGDSHLGLAGYYQAGDLHLGLAGYYQAGDSHLGLAGYYQAGDLHLGLAGHYQMENAATAMCAIKMLQGKGFAVSGEAVRAGLEQARWPGRMEQIHTEPDIFLDGAHNLHGVRALRESLVELYPGKKIHFLMGVLEDKDYKDMVSELLDLAARIDTVTPESTRAFPGEELSQIIAGKGVPSKYHSDLAEALIALRELPGEMPVCVFGSLYFIGEAERILHGEAERIP